MKAFEYATALSTDSARELVADHGAYLAGGNDLLGLLKEYLVPAPTFWSTSSRCPGLDKIEHGSKTWTIGALVTVGANRATTRKSRKFFPVCTTRPWKSPRSKSATSPPSAAISRNIRAAGISGIATRVCLKKSGDLCYARNSENRYHSLFTGNYCISPVVSSLATTFAALDATAIVLRDGKETRMSMAELYQRAWRKSARAQFAEPRRPDFARGNSDRAPAQRLFAGQRQACVRLGAGQLRGGGGSAGGKLKSPRVALGSISPVPHQVEAANHFLDGKVLDDAMASRRRT